MRSDLFGSVFFTEFFVHGNWATVFVVLLLANPPNFPSFTVQWSTILVVTVIFAVWIHVVNVIRISAQSFCIYLCLCAVRILLRKLCFLPRRNKMCRSFCPCRLRRVCCLCFLCCLYTSCPPYTVYLLRLLCPTFLFVLQPCFESL